MKYVVKMVILVAAGLTIMALTMVYHFTFGDGANQTKYYIEQYMRPDTAEDLKPGRTDTVYIRELPRNPETVPQIIRERKGDVIINIDM